MSKKALVLIAYILFHTSLYAWCPKGINIPAMNGSGKKNMSTYARNHDYDHLFIAYGKIYGFDPLLLKSFAVHESYLNHRTKPNGNDNGTVDAGLMRINSSNKALFKKYHITFKMVENPAVAVRLACEILTDKVKRYGKGAVNLRSISAYNGSQNCTNRAYYYGRTVMGIYARFKKLNAQLLAVNEKEFPVGNYAPLPNANNRFAFITDGIDSISNYFSPKTENDPIVMLRDEFSWKMKIH